MHIHMMDRDAAVALAKAVSNTLAPEQVETDDSFAASITELRDQINSTRAQIARMERELDAIALAGHVQV
jgi:hypothetical protein